MSQEVAKILMQEWIREWLDVLGEESTDLAWNLDYRAGTIVMEKFLKWIEANK
jgi:hypothetical protein